MEKILFSYIKNKEIIFENRLLSRILFQIFSTIWCIEIYSSTCKLDFFTVKEPTLHAVHVCYLHRWAFLKYMYIYIHDLFDLSNKQGGMVL